MGARQDAIIIVLVIGGAIIGLLGKLVAPGDQDNIPFWLTVLCGIGGVLLGNWHLRRALQRQRPAGIDWWRHIVAS